MKVQEECLLSVSFPNLFAVKTNRICYKQNSNISHALPNEQPSLEEKIISHHTRHNTYKGH